MVLEDAETNLLKHYPRTLQPAQNSMPSLKALLIVLKVPSLSLTKNWTHYIALFNCDSMKHKVILHWITTKYSVSRMKIPYVRDCAISVISPYVLLTSRTFQHIYSDISSHNQIVLFLSKHVKLRPLFDQYRFHSRTNLIVDSTTPYR